MEVGAQVNSPRAIANPKKVNNRFMKEFFKGLKVVELASVLAGPAVGTFFAELGASVTKIENKLSGGDVTRGWRVRHEGKDGISAYYAAVNYGKKSLILDFNDHVDRSKLNDLVSDADIVVSNYLPRVAQKFGLSYQDIKTVNQEVIYLDLLGYEHESKPAYDVVLQAETGWLSMTGTDKEHLAKLPVALIDIVAGHQLKEAALMGLLHKERTGQGSYTKCSLEAASLSALANQATNYLMVNTVAQPIGTGHPNIAPYGDMFQSKDEVRFVLAIGSDSHFNSLIHAFDLEVIKDDPRYATNNLRVENRENLIDELSVAFGQFTFSQIVHEMTTAVIPFGEIKTLDNVLSSRAAQEMILKEKIEDTSTQRLSSIAFKTSY